MNIRENSNNHQGEDVSDWLESGHTPHELLAEITQREISSLTAVDVLEWADGITRA